MSSLIIYDSYYRNTEQIAKAIAKGLQPDKEASLISIEEMSKEKLRGIQLLVVGSPTIGFHPSASIVKWMDKLSLNELAGIKVAAFDTRNRMDDQLPFVQNMFRSGYGYAARSIADFLVRKGGRLIARSEGFITQSIRGQISAGELERAAWWGAMLAKVAQKKAAPLHRIKFL